MRLANHPDRLNQKIEECLGPAVVSDIGCSVVVVVGWCEVEVVLVIAGKGSVWFVVLEVADRWSLILEVGSG